MQPALVKETEHRGLPTTIASKLENLNVNYKK